MCGIVGKIKLSSSSITEAEVKSMSDCLSHRGPDDAGIYLSKNGQVGLGHRRLSIIDTSSAGHQPMNYKNRYWITYNGELYNFAALKADLEQRGHRFQSQTDTEVILAMYDQYGKDCLSYFRGMFSFAIYDEQKNTLFCARDRAGQKPFKYFYDGDVFIFGSELKAILTQPEYKKAPDYLAIHHYLTYQYVPAPLTGFKDIKKLEPAHYLLLDIKHKKSEKQRYWHLDFSKKENYSEKQWGTKIVNKLEQATQEQMISDVPLGAFLSGGVDSSAVVALMSRHATGRIKTFSIGFPDKKYNELSYAKQVADHFRTEHTEFIVKPTTMDILPELVEHFEEPYADSSAIPTYYLSKLARDHVTVALNGDGGDENFAGYPWHNFHKLALMLDGLGLNKLSALRPIATAWHEQMPSTLTMRIVRFAESLADHPMRRYVTYSCYFTNSMKQNLYKPEFYSQFKASDSYDVVKNLAEASKASLFDQALYADISAYLPDDLLPKVDMASMRVSLEARSPFLDHEFMELSARIPGNLKLKGLRKNKYILKQAFKSILPDSILNRPKMGFRIPIEHWFRGNMKEYIRSVLLHKDAHITQELFQPSAITSLLDRHTNTKTNLAPQLWALLTLELWLRRYFP